jgi:transmembrane sensor
MHFLCAVKVDYWGRAVMEKFRRFMAMICGRSILFLFVFLQLGCREHERKTEENGSTVYKSGSEKRMKIILPGGTELVMNAGTVIRVSKNFGAKDGELWLEGEALFDVRGNAMTALPGGEGKGFVIHTKNLRIEVQVQGQDARFKVDAYPDKAGEEVDLLSGKLKVMKSYHSDSDNEPETIQTGELVMINRDIDLMEKEKMDGTEMKSWDAGN